MSRLIDADALKSVFNYLCEQKNVGTITIEAVEAIIDTAPTVSQWIPCNREMPKKNGRYLCSVDIGISRLCMIYGFATDLHAVSRIDFEYSRGAGFYDHDSEYGFAEVTEFVKAWCELPEPYKGVTDGRD